MIPTTHIGKPIFRWEYANWGLYYIEILFSWHGGVETESERHIRDRYGSSRVHCPGTPELRSAIDAWVRSNFRYIMNLDEFLLKTLGPGEV